MALTSEGVIKYIAGTLKTDMKTFCIAYYASEEAKKTIDKSINDINERRVKNGLEPVIIPKKYYDEFLNKI
jgi:hypothetical protein